MECSKQMLGLVALMIVVMGCQSNSQIIKDEEGILRGPVRSVEINTYKPDLRDGAIKKGELWNTSSFTLMGGGAN